MSWTCRELALGSPEYHASLALREAVLRRPLGLVWTAEELAKEKTSFHIGCFRDDELVGALVLTPEDGATVRMRLVAVAPEYQGQGVGSALIACAEDVARRLDYRRVVARARETAVPFYRKHGYRIEDEPFTQVGLPHRVVWKEL
jgi:GNAT superfamily N-acetyltransferase